MRWRRVLWVAGGVLGLGLLMQVVFQLNRHVPASFHNPPIFPSAVAVATAGRDLHDTPSFRVTSKIVSFHAPAEPATVLAFYRTTLVHDDWQLSDRDSTPTNLTALWTGGEYSGPLYLFHVATQARDPGQTVVTLTLEMEPGR